MAKGGSTVIKKITIVAGGAHGGAWKVAFADFMTAMMAFFLVMWLLNQSEETKKAVSDYFSTPSVMEYNFQNYGVEMTLEKLFLDLVNEPLKAIEEFLEPMDKTPNALDMGSKRVVTAFIADQMHDLAKNVSISPDGFEFDIMDRDLFVPGTAKPAPTFIQVMDNLKKITTGLEDSRVSIFSLLFRQSVAGSNTKLAENIAIERLDQVRNTIQGSLEHTTVDVAGSIQVKEKEGFIEGQNIRPPGLIRIRIKQKELKSNGQKPKKIGAIYGEGDASASAYDNFAKKVTESPNERK